MVVACYQYEDERGRVLLRKWRFEKVPPATQDVPFPKAEKAFRMEARSQEGYAWANPTHFEHKYPSAHDYFHGLLFNLPLLLADPPTVALTEGEKDSCALVDVGVPALSHWQGAQNFTEGQAERFRGYRGHIDLLADADPAGAADVIRRYDLLRAVGIPTGRMRIVLAAPGHKDAADHLAAGHALNEFREWPIDAMREVAKAAPPPPKGGKASRDYDPGVWATPMSTWTPQAGVVSGVRRRPAHHPSKPGGRVPEREARPPLPDRTTRSTRSREAQR